ncbi:MULTISPECIES: hypothetical protein [unclassified Variovorax]|uniref:hypothetical protein n=1 Tax=unclassified Variovorax TaxID=663243 RepID=UPI0008D8A08B|nr:MULTISPECIES: hypothetical protein [unclassified Variovorax]SEK13137.1 hypothetical protein SAMN05518853_11254 [Variovorax sp. OK202]SFD87443.1 hypothetical protein SAMN05444746_112128 [Variovorax sp. OK212]
MNDDLSPAFAVEACAEPAEPEERARQLQTPGFGRVFSDHMATIRYTEERGWHDARIAMSRFSGVWMGMKTIQEVVESSASVSMKSRACTPIRRSREN